MATKKKEENIETPEKKVDPNKEITKIETIGNKKYKARYKGDFLVHRELSIDKKGGE